MLSSEFKSYDESYSNLYCIQIILCEDNIFERETFEHTVAHELVHAYDLCRAKLDIRNCNNHAW